MPRMMQFFTLTNNLNHVVNLLSSQAGGAAIHLVPGIPFDRVPMEFVEHPDVRDMIEAGDLTPDDSTANGEAMAEAGDVDFSKPDAVKGARKAAAEKRKRDAAAAAADGDGGEKKGDGSAPWNA